MKASESGRPKDYEVKDAEHYQVIDVEYMALIGDKHRSCMHEMNKQN